MKKKIILVSILIVLLIVIILLGNKIDNKNENVQFEGINSGINNLLEDLPNENVEIEIDENFKEEQFDNYESNTNPINKEEKENQEIANKFANDILNISEDILPKDLNFSFYNYSPNVPKKIKYYDCEFIVEVEDYINTSISMMNPSLYMSTSFPFFNDKEKSAYKDIYKNLLQGIINDYGTIIGGINYEVFDIMDITNGFSGGMIFEVADCYILVKTMYIDNTGITNDNNENLNVISLSIGYISKQEYHIYEGPEHISLDFLEKYSNAKIKYYYYDADGKGYTFD